jgi:DNA-binding transcriptional ArsR family regulator
VTARRDGRLVYYRVTPQGLQPLVDWVAHYRAFWTEHVDRLGRLLDTMEDG